MASCRTYVDNAYNRKVGRVGKPIGSHVISRTNGSASRSSCSSSSGQRTYVDNAYNRRVGRVGKPIGTHVISSTGTEYYSSCSSSSSEDDGYDVRTHDNYVNNDFSRQHVRRVCEPVGTHVTSYSCSGGTVSSDVRTYEDNEYSRRVGMPLASRMTSPGNSGARSRTYVDDAGSRRVGTGTSSTEDSQNLFFERVARQFGIAGSRLQQEELEEARQRNNVQLSTDTSRARMNCIQPAAQDSHHCMVISIKELTGVNKEIGRGGFGVVLVGKWHGTPDPVAFKKLHNPSCLTKKKSDNFVKEVKIWASLQHPNVVKLFGPVADTDNNGVGFLMECLRLSLFKAIFRQEEHFSNENKKAIITQTADAIAYLHSKRIAHCDIKSENILLDSSNKVKLADFGLSKIKNAMETSMSVRDHADLGTPKYSAPEVLRGDLLSQSKLFPTDIYSLAVVIFEVFCETEPFDGLNEKQLMTQVGEKNLNPLKYCEQYQNEDFETNLSSQVKIILHKCWDSEPSKRPTADDFKAIWKHTNLTK